MKGFKLPQFKIDWTLSSGHVVWVLTILAILLGVLLAVQTNNHASIRVLQHEQKTSSSQIEELTKRLGDEKQNEREFQEEQRKSLLDLARILNEIRLEEAKRRSKR